MSTFFETTEVSLPSDTAVQVRRSFRAPRALVWRAHTEPSLFQRWMLGPPGWSMSICEMDVRPGGAFRCIWRSDADNNAFGVHGVYREVLAPGRLVHTEFYDPGDVGGDVGEGSLQTLDLQERDGVTTLTSLMEFRSRESRDAAVATGMTDGMEQSFAQLDAVIAKDFGSAPSKSEFSIPGQG